MVLSKKKFVILVVLVLCIVVGVYGSNKPLPEGVSAQSEAHSLSTVEFVYDLTYLKDGSVTREQKIFEKAFQLIDEAEKFIVLDMFLFNDDYSRKYTYPDVARQLTKKLIAKKKQNTNIKIVFITDEINTFYGAYPAKFLEELIKNDIEVVVTDLTQIRDSNPTYSGFWRLFLQWFGSSGKGWIPNAFSPDSPEVTLRSYLKLLNFKANHRKVILTDKKAMLTSANPHDASANHSNIAFVVEGNILKDIIVAEKSIASFSKGDLSAWKQIEIMPVLPPAKDNIEAEKQGNVRVSLLTEGKIKAHLLEAITKAQEGDKIFMGMFYLADRDLIEELISASQRGVEIQLVLDPNKDAFGIKKNGVPNRPVAAELVEKSAGAIKVRWYNTHGEQFHSKITMIRSKHTSTIIGGSANLTKRNLGDLNLEANLKFVADNDSELVIEVSNYFDRIWHNHGGVYTVEFDKYNDGGLNKTLLYRFQEWSGLSSF